MKKEWLTINNMRAFLLTEVILTSALFLSILTSFAGAYLYGQESTLASGNHTRAVILAKEGLDAVRNIRDSGYSNLIDGTYGLIISNNQWTLSGVQDTTGIFTRNIVITSIDATRKNVTSNVTWQQNEERTGSVSLYSRFTDWISYRVSDIGGGIITGDWSAPVKSGESSLLGSEHGGQKVQAQGNYVYVISREGKNFFIVDVSTSTSPVIKGSLTLSGNPQNLFVFGDYVYVASDSDSQELQIVNVTNKTSPSLAGSYNAPGNADAKGVFVVDNTAYIVRANSSSNEFAILNVSTSSSPTLRGSLNLGATGYELVVSGNYAYIASDNNTQELQVVNISNPASLSIVGSLNLALNEQNRSSSITLAGSKLYLGQGQNLYLINVATETAPTLFSSVNVSDYLNDISLDLGKDDTYLYLATSDVNKELKIYNVSSPTAPSLLGSYDLSGANPLYGVAYDPTVDRAYAVSNSTTASLIIFSPAP